jgi:hypothetical protein
MLHFYDGQIRRYITQTIRVLSHFTVKYADGSLIRIPVLYGDADKQVASIIRQNSENKINSVPRISVYISDLQLDKERLGDATYVGKVHIRERDIEGGAYTQGQGRNYTVERLMPTPFKLTMKVDIWSANTDQKLQILEQILVLFNPSLELQTTDNYIDWTSLSVLNLANMNWSSKSIPIGTQDAPIDVATLTLDTPIWISPPVKVKHLGVITSIITSLYQNSGSDSNEYIDGLGIPLVSGDTTLSTVLSKDIITVTDYNIQVYNNKVELLGPTESSIPREPNFEVAVRQGQPLDWNMVFSLYPGKFTPGSSMIYLVQPNGNEVVGTFVVTPTDFTALTVNWDADTYPTDDLINGDSQGRRANNKSAGTFDAIIDPHTVYPGHGMQNVVAGDRFLIIEDIGSDVNFKNNTYTGDSTATATAANNGPDGWKNSNGTDFVAKINDIIEWQGDHWQVIFEAAQETDTHIYQSNIYNENKVQYVWNGVQWAKSFEGQYKAGLWRIEL